MAQDQGPGTVQVVLGGPRKGWALVGYWALRSLCGIGPGAAAVRAAQLTLVGWVERVDVRPLT